METSVFDKVTQPESIMHLRQTTAPSNLLHHQEMRILFSKKNVNRMESSSVVSTLVQRLCTNIHFVDISV